LKKIKSSLRKKKVCPDINKTGSKTWQFYKANAGKRNRKSF
jgi:hypothetical protein